MLNMYLVLCCTVSMATIIPTMVYSAPFPNSVVLYNFLLMILIMIVNGVLDSECHILIPFQYPFHNSFIPIPLSSFPFHYPHSHTIISSFLYPHSHSTILIPHTIISSFLYPHSHCTILIPTPPPPPVPFLPLILHCVVYSSIAPFLMYNFPRSFYSV